MGAITPKDIKQRKAATAATHAELVQAIDQIENGANMRLWLFSGVFFALGWCSEVHFRIQKRKLRNGNKI